MRVLVTGASGLVGRHLVPVLLAHGHAVVATSRDPTQLSLPEGAERLAWDGQAKLEVPGHVDGIVHLLGEGIADGRWTSERMRRMRASRLESTRRIEEFVRSRKPAGRPAVLVSANAVGYYGLAPKGLMLEDNPPGDDFLATLCKDWEAAAAKVPTRVVVYRFGHVLAADGGYLGETLPFAKLGLAGPLGGGRQPLPWVHVGDVVAALLWALEQTPVQGTYNLVAPRHDRQKDLAKALNRVLPIPSILPVPGLALKARFGSGLAEAMLGGQDVDPAKLEATGFRFRHPDLGAAVADLLAPRDPA